MTDRIMAGNDPIVIQFEKYIDNKCTTEEVDVLIREFRKPGAKKRFGIQFDIFWSQVDSYPEYNGIHSFVLNEPEQVLNAAKKEEYRIRTVKKMQVSELLKVAATVILFVGLSISYIFYTRTLTDKVVMVEEKVGYGKMGHIKLQDGSQVKINAGSRLVYPSVFTNGKRELSLEGHAFFRVQKDSTKPFIVKTGIVDVTVMGTSFDVKSFPGESYSIVTVVTGKVKVKIKGMAHEFILLHNQQLLVDNRTKTGQIKNIISNIYGEWEEPTLIFDNTPLKDIFSNLERCYNVTIIRPPGFGDHCTATGEHRNESLESVLSTLRFLYNIQYKQQNDTILISGPGCK